MVVGLAQSGFFSNEVVTLCTIANPGGRRPAKGSPSHCGQAGSSESGCEQWMFGVDVVDKFGIPLGNCSAIDAGDGVGCRLKGV